MSSSLSSPSPSPSKIIIPDLVSHCTIPVRCNRNWRLASVESKRWLFRGGDLKQKKRDAFHGLKAGYLTSMCYPLAGYPQLRVCCDFMNYLFHLDNISDEMDHCGTLGTAIKVMDPLYHPESSRPTSRVGKMTKEYVLPPLHYSCSAHVVCQLLAASYPNGIAWRTATLYRDVRHVLPGYHRASSGPCQRNYS